ncbi:MAG: flavin reductase [Methanomassiliicoccales archaeon]|jgi:flavin reductase (DIM6/NTAB) family NADH-FMN oxidoreductase RutF
MDTRINLRIDGWETYGKLPHIEPIVIVTSISTDGVPDAALKSTFTFVNMNPHIVDFSCTMQHQTARDILTTKEFVINFPSEKIIKETLATLNEYRPSVDEIKEFGPTANLANRIRPPVIKSATLTSNAPSGG